jgi:hypothetical protein
MARREPFTHAADVEGLLMGHSPKLQSILEKARKRFRAGKGIPHEIFWKQVEAEKAGRTKKQRGKRAATPGG